MDEIIRIDDDFMPHCGSAYFNLAEYPELLSRANRPFLGLQSVICGWQLVENCLQLQQDRPTSTLTNLNGKLLLVDKQNSNILRTYLQKHCFFLLACEGPFHRGFHCDFTTKLKSLSKRAN